MKCKNQVLQSLDFFCNITIDNDESQLAGVRIYQFRHD